MPASKDLRQLLQRVKAAGWEVTQSNHRYKIKAPLNLGGPPLWISTNSGDIRSLQNMKAALKRAGFFEAELAASRRGQLRTVSDAAVDALETATATDANTESELTLEPPPETLTPEDVATLPELLSPPSRPATPATLRAQHEEDALPFTPPPPPPSTPRPPTAPPLVPDAARTGPDVFAVGLIRLGRHLAKLPLDPKAIQSIRSLLTEADSLGLLLRDVIDVLAVDD